MGKIVWLQLNISEYTTRIIIVRIVAMFKIQKKNLERIKI